MEEERGRRKLGGMRGYRERMRGSMQRIMVEDLKGGVASGDAFGVVEMDYWTCFLHWEAFGGPLFCDRRGVEGGTEKMTVINL